MFSNIRFRPVQLSYNRFGCFPLLHLLSVIPYGQISLTAFGATVELQYLRFNCGCDRSKLRCTKKALQIKYDQTVVCHEFHQLTHSGL